MPTMVLHQRTCLNSKGNRKGTDKKVVRCGNKRAFYALARRKILRIISCVFLNYKKEEVLNMSKMDLFLVLFTVG